MLLHLALAMVTVYCLMIGPVPVQISLNQYFQSVSRFLSNENYCFSKVSDCAGSMRVS